MKTVSDIPYMGQQAPYQNVCALLSLGNALLHFGVIDQPWDLTDPQFEEMVADAGGLHGPATEEGLERVEQRFQSESRWPRIGVDTYTALEISKELVIKLLEAGKVVAMSVWVEGVGLHSILIVGHENGPVGERFTAINREPFTDKPVKNSYSWDALGYRRWNVPVRAYSRKA